MTIYSFDTPIVYLVNRCNKWQILNSQTFTEEKL